MYEQTYRRLEKLKNTFDQLVILNQRHLAELHELRHYVNTLKDREDARERVLQKISEENEKLKKDGEGIPPPT